MKHVVSLSNGTKFFGGIVVFAMLLSGPSHANIILGYNTDGSPIYGAEPPGATGPIATPISTPRLILPVFVPSNSIASSLISKNT